MVEEICFNTLLSVKLRNLLRMKELCLPIDKLCPESAFSNLLQGSSPKIYIYFSLKIINNVVNTVKRMIVSNFWGRFIQIFVRLITS